MRSSPLSSRPHSRLHLRNAKVPRTEVKGSPTNSPAVMCKFPVERSVSCTSHDSICSILDGYVSGKSSPSPVVLPPEEISEEPQGLLRDVWQVELSLWTFSLSTIFALIWWQFSLKGLLKAGLLLTVATFASFGAAVVVAGAHLLHRRLADSISAAFRSECPSGTSSQSRLLQGVSVRQTGFHCLAQELVRG